MTTRFVVSHTEIPDLAVIKTISVGDDRGYFERIFCADELRPFIANRAIMQINHSYTSKRGTLRGLHFQYPPHSEMKMVSCIRGEVLDVVVDIRKGKPSFLKYHEEVLSANNRKILVIPEGFAHGFQALTDDCEMLYLHTAPYCQSSEGGINANDPLLSIPWPLPINQRSARDASHPMIEKDFMGVSL